MTKNPEEKKTKAGAGEKNYIIERRRDEKTGIVYDRAIREIDNITPFKEALQKLSTDTSKAVDAIRPLIKPALAQIEALVSDLESNEAFKAAQAAAAAELDFRTNELKKKYYKGASWEDILTEHSKAISTASDAEIAMSTREDGSVIIPGTMYEHYKKAWNDHVFLSVHNLLLPQPAKIKDKSFMLTAAAQRAIFPTQNEEDKTIIQKSFDSASREDKDNNISALTILTIDFSELGEDIARRLSSFDGEVLSACFSICRQKAIEEGRGNNELSQCITNIASIWEAMGYARKPNAREYEAVKTSLNKLRRILIDIDNSDEIAEAGYRYKNMTQEGATYIMIIEYTIAKFVNQKGKQVITDAVRLTPSLYMKYIADRQQFISVPREFMEINGVKKEERVSNTERSRQIRNYIIVSIKKWERPDGTSIILIDTLCERFNISKRPEDKAKQRAIDNIVKPILEGYKNKKLIEGYKITKDRIIIQVHPAPKLEPGKQKKKKG